MIRAFGRASVYREWWGEKLLVVRVVMGAGVGDFTVAEARSFAQVILTAADELEVQSDTAQPARAPDRPEVMGADLRGHDEVGK